MRPEPVVEETAAVDSVATRLPEEAGVEWVVHEPECKECHKSKTTQLAYVEPPELCWDCHDEEDFTDRFMHGPFAAGACLQCHSPHKSPQEYLLLDPPSELCGGCHGPTTFAELEQHRVERGDDCIECHSPHSAARRFLLNADFVPASKPAPERGAELQSESGSGAGL